MILVWRLDEKRKKTMAGLGSYIIDLEMSSIYREPIVHRIVCNGVTSCLR